MKPCCIAISATDPSSGAGVQLDVRLLKSHQIYPISVVSGITTQDIDTFSAFFPTPRVHFKSQLETAFSKFPAKVVKIGMLSDDNVEVLLSTLISLKSVKIVLDPILGSSSGVQVASYEKIALLIPHSYLVTPNVPEIERFIDAKVSSLQDLKDAIKKFYDTYKPHNILLKGGHFKGSPSLDLLYDGKEIYELVSEKIYDGVDVHGTGCFLSTSIAAYLCKGDNIFEAISKSKSDIVKAMNNACSIAGSYRKVFVDF